MTKCRFCAALIDFKRNENGNFLPINPLDGFTHICDEGRQQRRKEHFDNRPPDDQCLECQSHNVERLPGTAMHYGAIRCLDCHKHRWLRRPA